MFLAIGTASPTILFMNIPHSAPLTLQTYKISAPPFLRWPCYQMCYVHKFDLLVLLSSSSSLVAVKMNGASVWEAHLLQEVRSMTSDPDGRLCIALGGAPVLVLDGGSGDMLQELSLAAAHHLGCACTSGCCVT